VDRKIDLGLLAWGGLVVYVSAYDVAALKTGHSTLSSSFHKVSSKRFGTPVLLACCIYLTAHLFRWWPKQLDPLRRFVA
jgi:hypothetical protein